MAFIMGEPNRERHLGPALPADAPGTRGRQRRCQFG